MTPDDAAHSAIQPSDICPACGHGRLRRSHRRGFSEHLRSWTGYYPYRCQECKERCFKKREESGDAPARPDKRPEQKQRARRRMLREFLIYLFALVIFGAFLYYTTRMPMDPGP